MSKAATNASSLERIAQIKSKLTAARLVHAFEREALLVLFLGGSLFFWIALVSYSPLDASWTTAVYPKTPPGNLAGVYGAHLASIAVYLCGISACLLPLPLLGVALGIFRNKEHNLAPTRLLGWVVLILSACIGAALTQSTISLKGLDLPTGGLVGATLSQGLTRTFGFAGGLVVLTTAVLMAVLWLLRKPLIEPAMNSVAGLWRKVPLPSFPLFFGRTNRPNGKTTPDLAPENKYKGARGARNSHEKDPTGTPKDLGEDSNPLPTPRLARQVEVDSHSNDGFKDFDGPALDLPGLALGDQGDRHPAPVQPQPHYAQNFAAPSMPIGLVADKAEDEPTTQSIPTTSYTPPPLTVFNRAEGTQHQLSPHELESTSALLVKTFEDFGVQGSIIGYQPGPVVTVYEFQPDAGIKQSKILGLIDDLALALKVDSIFIHPVRGKRALGVQVPNSKREPVHLGDILSTPTFKEAPSPLSFGLGKTITGQPMCADLTGMPHLLVAGATGSGKSVGINAMLCSIIMKATPEQVRMILVDPKMLELSIYEGIPHLLMPVITEPSKASLALKWAASEMERRYRLMQLACVRNIEGFNDFWSKASTERRSQLREAMEDQTLDRLPFILLVIDELADLMMTAPKDVEAQIQRLAQKARASGIHMVLATQRPSVDIITGVIKANLPCRIAYQVVSKHDSRTILDIIGAEKLLGKGDLLFQKPGTGRLERLQGALITDEEVLNLVASVKASSEVQYNEKIISWIDEEFARQKDGGEGLEEASSSPDDEPKFNEAVAIARAHGVVSASFLQRHLKIGYNRAARIVEFMESKGMIDKADGAKPRKWLG